MTSSESLHTTLARLIAFPTVSDRPTDEIVAYLARRAEDRGMRAEVIPSGPNKANLVVRAGPEGTDGLTLSGHLDVVPTAGQAWSSDPFVMTEREGRLFGRGTCDMKGFVAAVVTALEDIDVSELKQELALVWTHDEEVGCCGSALLVERFLREGRGLPRQALIGEPTSQQPKRMHPGHSTFAVRLQGRAAHSSRPSLGLSAIKLAREALGAIEGLEEELRGERAYEDLLEAPYTVVNVGEISGGSAVNIVPEHCHLHLGMRALPGQSAAQLLARLQASLAPLAARAASEGGRVRAELLREAPALLCPDGAPLLNDLKALGDGGTPGAVPFATDGGNLARLGLDCVVCGPGSIDLAHRPDESIGIDELDVGVDLVTRLIRRRCG